MITIKTEYSSGNSKSWCKLVTGIDSAQRGGYAFEGDFLSEGEHELPEGSLILHVTHGGGVKNGLQYGNLYKVEADGNLSEIVTSLDWHEQWVTLRKTAEEYLAKQDAKVVDAAEAHISKLLASLMDEDLIAEMRRRGLSL